MSIQVEGTIERKGFGAGTWALVSTSGEIYELYQSPDQLNKQGLKVKVSAIPRDDVMTVAMIGPVVEVQSFQVLE